MGKPETQTEAGEGGRSNANDWPVSETPDKSVTCKDCSTDFTFTGREQDFFEEKGWGTAMRVRCHACSKAKKDGYAARGDAGSWSEGGQQKASRESEPLPEDKTAACKDCSADFVFTGKEQRFFSQKGFPKRSRCAACTTAKKAAGAQPKGTNAAGAPTCHRCKQEGHITKYCTEKRPAQKHSNPASHQPPTKKAAKPCHPFQRGECSRGDACIFVHASASSGAKKSKPVEKIGSENKEGLY